MIGKSVSRLQFLTRNRTWCGSFTKRAMDFAISLVALVLLAPLMGLIGVAIRRDTPGPAFYRGERAGRGGKVFRILKFRTMYETPESYSGPKVTGQDDPRVTPLGRWLRSTKLNELPQFWNVLKGEMSLVGPRPEDPTIVQDWPTAVRDEILSARPGITSPASVVYRHEETLLCDADVFGKYVQELGPDKMRLDQQYVRNCSYCLDLDTLLWTTLIFVPKLGSYALPERLLFVGPITRLVRRYVNWFVADLFVTLVVIGCTGLLWRAFGPLDVGRLKSFVAALALALLFSVTSAVLGVNHIDWSKATRRDGYDLFGAWAIATMLALVANLLAGGLPFGLIVVASVLAFYGFVAVRYRGRLATGLATQLVHYRARSHTGRERVLIVGSGQTAQQAAWILNHPENVRKFRVCGFVDDNLFAQGMRVYGAKVVGTWNDIPKLVAKQDIKVIILAADEVTTEQYHGIESVCRATKTRFVLMPNLVDSLSDLCQGPLSAGQTSGEAHDATDFNCLECMARRGVSQAASVLRGLEDPNR